MIILVVVDVVRSNDKYIGRTTAKIKPAIRKPAVKHRTHEHIDAQHGNSFDRNLNMENDHIIYNRVN